MAYISTEQVKSIRDQIKSAYPRYKWSVSRRHHSTVVIVLQESDLPIETKHQVNQYWYKTDEKLDDKSKKVISRVLDICNSVERCYDRNAGDVGADYGDSTYFIDMDIGKWDKPHKIIPAIGVRHPRAIVGKELTPDQMTAYREECERNRAKVITPSELPEESFNKCFRHVTDKTPVILSAPMGEVDAAPVIIRQWTHGSMLITEEAIIS